MAIDGSAHIYLTKNVCVTVKVGFLFLLQNLDFLVFESQKAIFSQRHSKRN